MRLSSIFHFLLAIGLLAAPPLRAAGESALYIHPSTGVITRPVTASTFRSANSIQTLDADLTAISALSGTNTIYYRSADGVWTSVTIGSALSFSGGTLTITAGGVTNAMLAGSIDLTSKVAGTLPVANGGTGLTSLGSGVATWLGTPNAANFLAAQTGETGTGSPVFNISPTIQMPTFTDTSGATVLNFSDPSDAVNYLTIRNAATGNAVALLAAGTDLDVGLDFVPKGSGSVTANGQRVLTVADLGVTTQAYDADLATWAGITPAANVGTFLATPSSANLRAALTDESGTGAAIFADTPTFATKILVPDGSASAPAIARSAQTNTGIYFSANQIDYTIAGTANHLAVNASGITTTALYALSGRIRAGTKFDANDLAGTTDIKVSVSNGNTADSTELNGLTGGDQDFSVTKTAVTASMIAGKPIKVTAYFRYSTDAASAGTLNLKLKAGAVTLVDFGAITLTTAMAGRGIVAECVLVPRTLGASGAVAAMGALHIDTGGLAGQTTIPNTSDKVVNTTGSNVLKFSAAFSVADADNKITLETLITE